MKAGPVDACGRAGQPNEQRNTTAGLVGHEFTFFLQRKSLSRLGEGASTRHLHAEYDAALNTDATSLFIMISCKKSRFPAELNEAWKS